MKPEAEKLLDLAQKRLDALRALAAAISEAQMALTNLDLEVIEENIERQKSLCSAISDLDSEIMCLRRLLNGKMRFRRDYGVHCGAPCRLFNFVFLHRIWGSIGRLGLRRISCSPKGGPGNSWEPSPEA